MPDLESTSYNVTNSNGTKMYNKIKRKYLTKTQKIYIMMQLIHARVQIMKTEGSVKWAASGVLS